MKDKINEVLMENNMITHDKNIIYAGRAFIAHSAAQWGLDKIARNEFSEKQISNFGKMLMMYLRGELEMSWENRMLKVLYTGEKVEPLEELKE